MGNGQPAKRHGADGDFEVEAVPIERLYFNLGYHFRLIIKRVVPVELVAKEAAGNAHQLIRALGVKEGSELLEERDRGQALRPHFL